MAVIGSVEARLFIQVFDNAHQIATFDLEMDSETWRRDDGTLNLGPSLADGLEAIAKQIRADQA